MCWLRIGFWGKDVDVIRGKLSYEQVESIGVQLGYILEYVAPSREETLGGWCGVWLTKVIGNWDG